VLKIKRRRIKNEFDYHRCVFPYLASQIYRVYWRKISKHV
jgi:hypothetical protein